MGTGLLVTDVMGQGVNIVTGIILVAQPVLGGKWRDPISGCRNYHCRSITRYVENIVAVADDVEHRSNIQTGSIFTRQDENFRELINFIKMIIILIDR